MIHVLIALSMFSVGTVVGVIVCCAAELEDQRGRHLER